MVKKTFLKIILTFCSVATFQTFKRQQKMERIINFRRWSLCDDLEIERQEQEELKLKISGAPRCSAQNQKIRRMHKWKRQQGASKFL
jgi:hypothetical protein